MISTLYTNISTTVVSDGQLGLSFNIHRGTRQGDPVSALLFLCVMQILSNHIKQSEEIKGIQVGHTFLKLEMLADDTTLYLSDLNDIKNAVKILDEFRKISGLKTNKDKCEVMWIGAMANSNLKGLNLKWVKQINSLGLIITPSINDTIMKNYRNIMIKISHLCKFYKRFNFNVIERAYVLNTYILSQ